jgi:hypothetical protein
VIDKCSVIAEKTGVKQLLHTAVIIPDQKLKESQKMTADNR